MPRSEVREVARLLTGRYAGLTFQEIRAKVADAGPSPDAERVQRVAAFVARKVFQSLWDRNLYVGGAMNMLDQPEFAHRDDAGPPQDVRGEAPARSSS